MLIVTPYLIYYLVDSTYGGRERKHSPQEPEYVPRQHRSVWVKRHVGVWHDTTGDEFNLKINLSILEEDALSLLFVGDTNRAISETAMNKQSSRSHCIFTVTVTLDPFPILSSKP